MSLIIIIKLAACLSLICLTCASPAKPSFWKGTPLDSTVEEMRSLCAEDDPIACLKLKAVTFLDNLFQKDAFQVSDSVEVTRNSGANDVVSARSDNSLEGKIEQYVKTHDVTFKLPVVDSSVTLGARNLDSEELDLKLNFGSGVQEARKSKLKKIFIPILVFVLLKAMTLIPLALGVLGLKAWNALQLSFFSFVVSVALAVFQLCKKIATDSAHPPIAAHGWEAAAKRSYEVPVAGAQELAYSAYAQPQQ